MKFLVITGIIIFIVFSYFFFNDWSYYSQMDERGKIVQMQIVKLPANCPIKKRYNVKFQYNGQIFSKSMRGKFCKKHQVGEYVPMKYLEGYSRIFKPHESGMLQLLSLAIIAISGLILAIYYWKK